MATTLPKPPLIIYNLKERGRQHRGQERNFDIKAICDAINSPACQERVSTRAMLGYFGHKIRILCGLEPVESGVVSGKYNEFEPAIVTTHLKAYPDGTIEHQTEFLDSVPGRKAARMYSNRIGGFSSAIDERQPQFFGFDYVLDPNYSGNRGFALDSVNLTLDEVLDSVKSEDDEFMQRLIDVKNAEIAQLQAALDSASIENEELMGMMLKKDMTLDDASLTPLMPLSVNLYGMDRIKSDIAAFNKETKLTGYVEPAPDGRKQAEYEYDKLAGMMGFGRV
ncbi:MAG: hypothetical protein ACXWT0_00175 [Methylobacter sp.]